MKFVFRIPVSLSRTAALAAVVSVAMTSPAKGQLPCRYGVAHVIQGPPCEFGLPSPAGGNGISPNGRYVCGVHGGQCDVPYPEAFIFDTTTGQMLTIPRPAGVLGATAVDVNDAGQIVGYCTTTGTNFVGFVYELASNHWTFLPAPHPQGWSSATAINNNGMICGWRSLDDGGDPVNPYNAFIYDIAAGQFTDLGVMNGPNSAATDINDNNEVCGWMGNASHSNNARGFLWSNGKIVEFGLLPNGLNCAPQALNNSGEICGWAKIDLGTDTTNHAFFWSKGDLIDLGTLPPNDNVSLAADIGEDGMVIGLSRQTSRGDRGFLWHAGELRDVNDFIDPSLGMTILACSAHSDSGSLVGAALSGNGPMAVVLTPSTSQKADLDGNCVVDADDLLSVIVAWGQTGSPADLDGNGIVGVPNLLIVIQQWTFE